ncbi:PREDICTED: lymphocyte cytosolic protein 2-like isoform X2 [Trachymyrmex cornetzi]|uniref:lymphocyte cytosolic protein 2-like isoform X2 n=1 Tax=Trachymyrmex cornetzi TaxID=471704 RepID=UPI00084F0CEB|nr:PREDICTED: lymphocyte cytosolic protein 2-like isoform X2 [Trachymyrmex cornetzi]
MSKKLSRADALNNISTWDTEGVLCLLRKNGLEECCKAVMKRQIDGDELLHLTDGKLALWKSDLTRPLIGKLLTFVQELNKSPELYLLDKIIEIQQNDDHLSDSGSWGTDFEDEAAEENNSTANVQEIIKPSLIKNKQMSLQNNGIPISRIPTLLQPKKIIKPEQEETYANCKSSPNEEENMYANCQEMKPPPMRNVSRLHNELEKTLAEKLKLELEELKRRNGPTKKPEIRSKPETLPLKKIPMTASDKKSPQKSFLHNGPKMHERVPNEQSKTQRRMGVPPPPEPKRNKDYTSEEIKKGADKELSIPPIILRNFDLVANLPAQTEESEDEYEPFDENIIEKNEISRVDSKQSLHSGRQGSVESVYKPPSAASHEEEEDYEIYESITETPEDNDYLSPIQRTNDTQEPPPLPAKPSPPPLSSTLPSRTKSEKERSPDKKSATLPHAGGNTSMSTERATRPLPPPPERSYIDKPWFHNISREQAIILIKEQGTYSNPQDGYFLLRPSMTNLGNPLTLVLWYKDRVYNVPVRKRSDNRYALGSAKVNELSFSTVEEIIVFHMKEELMLYSGGVQTGSTKLTDTPPK